MAKPSNAKNCPFCGENDRIHVARFPSQPFYFVFCGSCDTQGPGAIDEPGAICAWNNRKKGKK